MKSFSILSIALLMSGIAQAADPTYKINVENMTDISVVVTINFEQSAQGKNLTTGAAATVCAPGGSVAGLIKAGVTNSMSYSPCQPGAKVTVSTVATNPRDKKTISTIDIGPKAKKVTVSGKAGTYAVAKSE